MSKWCLLLLGSFSLINSSGQAAAVFAYGADWRYFIGTREASSPDPTAWRMASFNDSMWISAPTPIGYANPPNSEPEFNLVTLLPSTQEGNYASVFLRKKFKVNTPADVTQISLSINIDDGFVAWINGNEIGRYNVPAGTLNYNSTASSAIEPTLVALTLTNDVPSLLTGGDNVLAVQVFNANLSSSDLFFDAAMDSDLDETAPVVIDTTPLPGSIVPQLDSIEIVFGENVQGVDAADLFINGIPASSLNLISPRDYVFSFAQSPTGAVVVTWAPGHGITDISSARNPFSGGSWKYTVNPDAPASGLVISEFMADNANGIKDDDGAHSDWIELFNAGSETTRLTGWFLTDNRTNLAKWRLPAVNLKTKNYLLVWASGQNRTNPEAQLHTNFKLNKGGSYLALVDPNTNIISEFSPTYPPQRTDISYGRDAADPLITGYFPTPTPGSANSTSGPGFAPEPGFSLIGGVWTNESVVISLSAPSGQIRFTLDGSPPNSASPIYTGPITLSNSRTVSARVFQNGLLPSAIIANSYILVDNSVAGFTSKLPLMFISTSGRGIVDHPPAGTARTLASLATVDTFRGRSSTLGPLDYLGQAGISIRGQTSSGFPKQPYRLELMDQSGFSRNSELLGLPSGNDWVLNNPYTDKPFLQNFLAYELFEKMGHYSVRRRFVEVFINTANRRISYPQDYAGVYILLEKIQADENRVPIEKLTPYDTAEPEITGGYMFKKDKDSSGDLNFYTPGGAGFSGQGLKIHEPLPREITTDQYNWLVNYLNQFESKLYASNWKTAQGTNHYSWYLDVDSFVDYHWIVEFSKQIDGYRLSNYLQKDRNGKIKMAPIWDWNLSFGNADYFDGWLTSGWYYSLISENEHIWLRRLICGTTSPTDNSGDPDFNQRIADRWSELRTNVFALTNVLARVDELAALLSEAANRDFQKWPRLGTYVWPNPDFYVTPTTYAGVIASMKNWIRGRFNWIDAQFILPPRTSVPAGRIPAGLNISLSGAGTIYYTLDGSDPRLSGGGISSKAVPFSGPITLSGNARLVARSRVGSRWSGPLAATYVVQPVSLIITEIMYHPAPPPEDSPFAPEDFEFLEFKNYGSLTLELGGFRITSGVSFLFPSYQLNPGARVLVVKNRAAFESRYGTGFPIAGEYTGQLDNGGERITVTGPWQQNVLSVQYDSSWYRVTDGPGFSLVPLDESGSTENPSTPVNWRPGAAWNGSPGQPKPPAPLLPQVVINEALTRSTSGHIAVELHNLSTTTPADVSDWFVTDNFDKPGKFRISPHTVISPGGFLVFTEHDFNSTNSSPPFSLNPLGEEIYLFSADTNAILTGYVHGFKYGASKADVTFGRYLNSLGKELFVAQSLSTLGSENSTPLISPVAINEIMYHPPDVTLNGAFWNNNEDEYIELHNHSNNAVQFFDPSYPTNVWQIEGEIAFSFPPNTTIAPGGFLLVVNFDPALYPAKLSAFRQKYQVAAATPVLGPFKGNLDNTGGSISLFYPDTPSADGTVPSVLLERIDYSNGLGWPAGADGTGYGLSRKEPSQFGNDPANWNAAPPTPGRTNIDAFGPVIVQHPVDQLALASHQLQLKVVTTNQDTVAYQWRYEGSNIPGATNATLLLTNAQPAQSGEYSVVVLGLQGATTSNPAYVSIGRDYDGDGMDDDWELANGFNPFDASDATPDADGDGFSNRNEYQAGTEPHNAQSYLKLEPIVFGSETRLSFRAAANRTYTIQYTDSLNPLSWQTLTNYYARPTEHAATANDPSKSSNRYYRLVTPWQP